MLMCLLYTTADVVGDTIETAVAVVAAAACIEMTAADTDISCRCLLLRRYPRRETQRLFHHCFGHDRLYCALFT